MSEIIKHCKIHGDLKLEQTYNYGKGILCKPCQKLRYEKWVSKNKDTCNERSLKWAKNNPEKVSESKKKSWFKNHEKNILVSREKYQKHKEVRKHDSLVRYHKNRGHYANTRLKRLFGMTLEEYSLLCESQNNCCAICKKPETLLDNKQLGIRKLAVDHCHVTNKIRGLLCFKCNIGLGKFNDSIDELKNAISYLESFIV